MQFPRLDIKEADSSYIQPKSLKELVRMKLVIVDWKCRRSDDQPTKQHQQKYDFEQTKDGVVFVTRAKQKTGSKK